MSALFVEFRFVSRSSLLTFCFHSDSLVDVEFRQSVSSISKAAASILKIFHNKANMGGLFSYFKNLFGNREMRILILGLDGAGKTTLLYRLQVNH